MTFLTGSRKWLAGLVMTGGLLCTFTGTTHADTIAKSIDSKTAQTKPGDVWEGTITFDGIDDIQ